MFEVTGVVMLVLAIAIAFADMLLYKMKIPTISLYMMNAAWKWPFPVVFLTGVSVGFFCGHFLWPLCGKP